VPTRHHSKTILERKKSPKTSETKAFSGQDPVRCKIIAVDNKCLQQVRNFKYLGSEISYENGRDIQQKLS
jgi:hypothetical protein